MIDIAIIGAGLMGRWHLDAARRAGARVLGVIDPDLSAAGRLARLAPGAMAAARLEDLLAKRRIKAAHVCSPAATHLPIALQLIDEGIDALIEKPLAMTLADTRTIFGKAAKKGVQVCPVHQYAFQRGVEDTLAALPSLGQVRRIDFNICSAGADTPGAPDGDAVAADILPHPISMLQRLAPATDVGDLAWTVTRPAAGELLAVAVAGETLVTLFISLNARPTSFGARVQADGGTMEIDGFHGYATRLDGQVSRLSKITLPFERALKGLGAASANLAARSVTGEAAYPGLRSLIRQFYASACDSGAPPIPPQVALAAAAARDHILAGLTEAPAHGRG
jgi:predicted dehydrogenase